MPSEIYSATYEMAQVLVDDVSLSDGISLLRCDYVPSILQVSESVRINPTLDLNALWLSAAFQVTEVSMTSALLLFTGTILCPISLSLVIVQIKSRFFKLGNEYLL